MWYESESAEKNRNTSKIKENKMPIRDYVGWKCVFVGWKCERHIIIASHESIY